MTSYVGSEPRGMPPRSQPGLDPRRPRRWLANTGTTAALLVASLAAGWTIPSRAATAERRPAGTLHDGTPIEAVTLRGAGGRSATILTYGATLQSLIAPDRGGRPADIVLGFDTPAEYEAAHSFTGAIVGRYANRIARGRFTLDGVAYTLPVNNGANHLHGGPNGFDHLVWQIAAVTSGATASVTLTHVSPDGDAGYPGELTASVTYALDDHGALTITFTARTTRPTIVNLTSHALYNLAGDCSAQGALQERLTIPASRYTPVDATLIPTGELRPVAGTVFDFIRGRVLASGSRAGGDEQIRIGRGYDHNWALDKGHTDTPQLAARLEDPASGRVLEILSTEPGLQMYSGNFLDGAVAGRNGCVYRMGDGIALEPQRFPDTPNRPSFGSARLNQGEIYHHVMILRTSTY